MARLMFVGQAVVDHCFEVEAFSRQGGKQVASGFRSEAGGLATNAARAAQRLRAADGPTIALCAAVGADAAGQWLLEQLRADGLELSALRQVSGARTAVSAVLADASGERQIHNFRGSAYESAAPPSALELNGCNAVLADPRWPRAAEAALRWARAHGAISMLDAEVAPTDVLRALVPLASWVVFSTDGLAAWAGDRAPTPVEALHRLAAAAGLPRELIVTQGPAGLSWCRPDGSVRQLPAFEVAVADSNGAGDVFHGALLLALAEGRAPEVAVRRAMAAAALACTRAGGAAAAPNRAELEHYLRHQP